MEVIYSLIPGMIFIGLLTIGLLIWAVRKGQYDDLEGDGNRLLMDEDEPLAKKDGTSKKDKGYWPDADD